jgi:hypothetical protein
MATCNESVFFPCTHLADCGRPLHILELFNDLLDSTAAPAPSRGCCAGVQRPEAGVQYLEGADRGDPRRQRQPGVSLPAPEQGAQQEWMGSSYQDPQPWSAASRWQVCGMSSILP